MATYVLGINAYHGDVSAVLLRDGQLVAAVEEERFRRIKHWAGFPTLAIQSVLDMAGHSRPRRRSRRDQPRSEGQPAPEGAVHRHASPGPPPRARSRAQRGQGARPPRPARRRVRRSARRPADAPLRRAPPGPSRQRVLRLAVRIGRLLRHRRVRRFRQHVVRDRLTAITSTCSTRCTSRTRSG